MKFGIIVASRSDSSRIREKPFQKINGMELIQHLLSRCLAMPGVKTILAIPKADVERYSHLFSMPGLIVSYGHDNDPMARLAMAAADAELDYVIRICHDKILIDPDLIYRGIEAIKTTKADYLYSSQLTDGSGFEIISRPILIQACEKFRRVEHVSYSIKAITQNVVNLQIPERMRSRHRFLIDYPSDLTLMELILSQCGNACSLSDAIQFMQDNPWAERINKLPRITVYTCAFNAERWLEKCVRSVAEQSIFGRCEYIMLDDHSTDKTPAIMARLSTELKNARFIRNQNNIGLASSSNVALGEARGKYLVRLDADDFFVGRHALERLYYEIASTKVDAVYPANLYGDTGRTQPGNECHHVGGAIFRRSAVNHIKFTEKLRGYEGLDFFVRAKDQIKIGYLGTPCFYYRQHAGSMSKTNLAERERIKGVIEAQNGVTHA